MGDSVFWIFGDADEAQVNISGCPSLTRELCSQTAGGLGAELVDETGDYYFDDSGHYRVMMAWLLENGAIVRDF